MTIRAVCVLFLTLATCGRVIAQENLNYSLAKYAKFNTLDGKFEFACPDSAFVYSNNWHIVWGFGEDVGADNWVRGTIVPVHSNGAFRADFELPEYVELPTVYGCELINGEYVKRTVLLKFNQQNDEESVRLRAEYKEMLIRDFAEEEYYGRHDSAQYLWARSRAEFPGTFDYIGSKSDTFSKWTNAYKVAFYDASLDFKLDETTLSTETNVVDLAKNYLLALVQNDMVVYNRVVYNADRDWFYTKDGGMRNRWIEGYTHARLLCCAKLVSNYGTFYCMYYRLWTEGPEGASKVKFGVIPCYNSNGVLKICKRYFCNLFELYTICGANNNDQFQITRGGLKSEVLPKIHLLSLPAAWTEWP